MSGPPAYGRTRPGANLELPAMPRGVVDESFGPARALRDVGTDRGQRIRVDHRLTPLARLSPTNTTGPSATMASPNKTALAPTPPTSPSAATSPAGTDRNRPDYSGFSG